MNLVPVFIQCTDRYFYVFSLIILPILQVKIPWWIIIFQNISHLFRYTIVTLYLISNLRYYIQHFLNFVFWFKNLRRKFVYLKHILWNRCYVCFYNSINCSHEKVTLHCKYFGLEGHRALMLNVFLRTLKHLCHTQCVLLCF